MSGGSGFGNTLFLSQGSGAFLAGPHERLLFALRFEKRLIFGVNFFDNHPLASGLLVVWVYG
ncbi:MAG: hypothetical protein M2R45_04512 [Verrucomicrobia subdivision 3 bacterium]|nr:hypothetical protein [Limisphaerales bacterium]MCS1415941.1 hypothetical protein [Limisphaerales bacterium]